MNRIDRLFQEKKERILSIYITAGFPARDDTAKVISMLDEAGADMIEIGMPFSDPLADGPVIQESSQKALKNGMQTDLLFTQLEEIRSRVHIPLVIMGYLNPVLQYGFERFVLRCQMLQIDGLILPDLPLEVYEKDYREIVEKAGLKFIMLITPNTSKDRIERIVSLSGGFVYMVADSSTTGARDGISDAQLDYFKRIQAMKIELPRLIGFGISNAASFEKACNYANGAIIGSAFIKMLGASPENKIGENIKDFVTSINKS